MKDKPIRDIYRSSGIRIGADGVKIPYEEILDVDGSPTFLQYYHNDILDHFIKEGKQTPLDCYSTFDQDTLDDGKVITRILPTPINDLCWFPAGSLPKERLDHNTLWDQVKGCLYAHLDFADPRLYDVVTAWIFASYIPETFQSVPYLFFHGPVKSGKTRCLEMLQHLAFRGWLAVNVSGPVIYRGIDAWSPTLLIDETEVLNDETRGDIISVVNSGYRRGSRVPRTVRTKEDDFQVKLFKAFGFKALAGIRSLKNTIESRSIIVTMFKAVRKLRLLIDRNTATYLRTHLLLWRLETLYTYLNSEHSEDNEDSEAFQEVYTALEFANDGRFIEKYYPLCMVANNGHDNIIDYAKYTHELEQLSEETSYEAQVVQAIINCKNTVESGSISLKNILEAFNADRGDNDKWKSRMIGGFVKRLGFHKKRMTGGATGYIMDNNILQRNIQRYGLTPLDIPSPRTSSLSSLPSLSSPKPELETYLDKHTAVTAMPNKEYSLTDTIQEFTASNEEKRNQL